VTTSRPRPTWLLPAVVGLVAAGLAWLRWIDPTTWNVVDLVDFVQGGRSVLDGTDIYGVYPGVLAFNYPPFGALVCVPLGLLGIVGSTWLMTSLSVASYVLIVRVSVERSGWGGSRAASWSWTGVLVMLGLVFEPVQRTFILGQLNLVLAALVLLDLFVVPRWAKGLLLGVAAGIKMTPAFFAAYYLAKRDWASAARSLASGVGTVVVGWLVLPSASTAYWLGGMDKLSRFGDEAFRPANQSLRAVGVRLLAGDPGIAYPISALLVAGLAAYTCFRLVSAGEDLAGVTVLAAGSLLISPISWTHHWVWIIPALVVLARRGKRVWVVLVSLLMFLPPMWAVTGDPLRLSLPEQVLASAYVLLGVAYLLGMTWAAHSRSTPTLPAAPPAVSELAETRQH
jgi:alpha-1,2-mannosyltransferase